MCRPIIYYINVSIKQTKGVVRIMELENRNKISEILYEFISDILEWDTDGPNKEVVTEHGLRLELKNNTSKNSITKCLALRRTRDSVLFDLHISVTTGIISTRLSELIFGTPDRFYRDDNKWALYIDNDVYLTSVIEERISWFGFLALIKSIINSDFARCVEGQEIQSSVNKLFNHPSCNMDALTKFWDWVTYYRFDKKKYLLEFYTDGVDTSVEAQAQREEDKMINNQERGLANRKIKPSTNQTKVIRNRRLVMDITGTSDNQQAQSMSDIFREAYGR